MSISCKDNNLKVWDANRWECILNLTNINKEGYLVSACFININEGSYIVTSNYNLDKKKVDPIKVYDLNGQKINEIENSNISTMFIDTYYDKILSKYYIITGNVGFSQSYNYDKNNIYHNYNDNSKYYPFNIIIKNNKGIIKLIESCADGIIRIFNFHSGLLLNKIKISNQMLGGICLWNDNYLFVGCQDRTIKLVEIKNGLIANSLNGHNNYVITIRKIFHPKYGECLISQNMRKSDIKLWINNP